MIKTTFTCYSLKTKHFFRFLPRWFFSGRSKKHNDRCRKEIAKYFDTDEEAVFLFGAARMGLYSLLVSGGAEGRDEVIVAGYTCVVVTNAIQYAELQAVYIDVEEDNLNLDPNLLRSAINSRTKAIIFTHNFGITCEYIDEFKSDYPDIMIIEDAAHTFGSRTNDGRLAGSIGDASYFSLEFSKPLSTGMGGIMLVNDIELRRKITDFYYGLPYNPRITDLRIIASLMIHLFSSSRYNAFLKPWMVRAFYALGLLYYAPPGEVKGEMPKHFAVKLLPALSYLLYLQVKEISDINRRKDKRCCEYHDTLKGLKGIRQYYSENYNFVRYPVLFEASVQPESIIRIKRELIKAGIGYGVWFNDVVHPKGSYRYCYTKGICPVGESVSERIINFPVSIHKQLNAKDLQKVRQIFIKSLDAE